MATKKILIDLDIDGDLTADSFIKDGGTSSQFLKADGSVDSNAYITSASIPTATSDLTNDSGFITDGNTNWNNSYGFITASSLPTATSDLTNDSGFLSSVTGDWTGTFDGEEGSYYLNYNNLTNKPTLFDGAYSSLSGLPTLAPSNAEQNVQSDWNATSGDAFIQNKPSLFDGAYSSLSGLPTLFDGNYNSLSNLPTLAPSNAEQNVQSDWNATTGDAFIKNKPTLFDGAYSSLSGLPTLAPSNAEQNVQSDWNATTGDALILNKPTLFDGAYSSLTGQPTLFDGAYSSLTGTPTIPSGNQIIDWTTDQGATNIHVNNITGYQVAGNYFTDGDTTLNMANNDGLVYDDTNNKMYVKLDGTNREILHTGNTTIPSGNSIIDWTTDQGATNIHANNYTNTNQLTTFQVEDGDGTEVTISHGKEWKFVEGQGIDVNWTDTNSGTDADPFDLQFALKANGVRANELNVTGNGTTSQYLRSDGDGSFTWATPTNTVTNISISHGADAVTVVSSDGTDGNINAATTALAGVVTAGPQNFSGGKSFYSTVEGMGGNLHSYGGDVAFDAFQGYGTIRELGTDEYVIPFLGAPHIVGQGNLTAGTTNSRAGVSTYIETAKYNFTTNDQIPYGVIWVRRQGKALISLIAKEKDEASSHISSRLKVGYTPSDNYGDQTNTNTLDVNGNIHAVSSVAASSFVKDGGTSSQFLKADGSVDSNTYLTSSSTQSKYLRSDTNDTMNGNLTLNGALDVFSTGGDQFMKMEQGIATITMGDMDAISWGSTFKIEGNTGNFKWERDGTEQMRLTNGSVLHVDNDVIAFSTTISDRRLKDDIQTIENASETVKKLRGVSYEWNAGNRKGQKEIGLVAQEVEEVLPFLVREHELPLTKGAVEGELYKTVDYEKLVGLLIEDSKEKDARIERLEAMVELMLKK